MNNTIYGRLFAYRQRESRSPLEDYLTEIVRHFLEEMTNEDSIEFCKINFVPAKLHAEFESLCTGQILRWRTQKRISQLKRLDLLLEIQDYPIIIIESKISSPIGVHKSINAETEIEKISQLKIYGSWQFQKLKTFPFTWPGVLVLLTHNTPPPDDFGINEDYSLPYEVCTQVAFWRQIHSTIQNFKSLTNEAYRYGRLQYISSNLADFLKSKGMGSFSMKPTDLAVMELYMHSASNVEGTVSDISKTVLQKFGSYLSNQRPEDIAVVPSNKTISGWRYFKKNNLKSDTCIWWGIRFSYESDHWTDLIPSLPYTTCVFVAVAAEGDPINLSALTAATPNMKWACNQSTAVLAEDIGEFSSVPNEMSEKIKTWVISNLDIIIPHVLPLL